MASKRKSKPEKKNDNPTAQILENVELLIALHEELNESASSTGGIDSDLIVDAISQKLESQIEKRFDAIESKLADIEDKLRKKESNPLSASKIQDRFEGLDTQLEKVSIAIAGQQQLIEDRTTNVDASDINSLRDQFSEMLGQVKSKLADSSAGQTDSDQDDKDNQETSSETDWSGQKQAMLSKYGIDPEHRPSMTLPTEPDPVLEATIADGQLNTSVDLETEKETSTDPEEIQRLTKEMNLKLRNAEVELSIERAKLSQLEAELESKQVELERRDLALSQKYGDRDSHNQQEEQSNLLDRLKKHLTAKDRKNLDRI